MRFLFPLLLLLNLGLVAFAETPSLDTTFCRLNEISDKFQPEKRLFAGPSLTIYYQHAMKLELRPMLQWLLPEKTGTAIWQFTYWGKEWIFADSIVVLCRDKVVGLPKYEKPIRDLKSGYNLKANEIFLVSLPDAFIKEFAQVPDSSFELRIMGSRGYLDVSVNPEMARCLKELQRQIGERQVNLQRGN